MPDYDEDEADDLNDDEDPDPSDQDSTDEDGEECPHCGKPIFEDANICPHCLLPVDEAVHNWNNRRPWFTFGLLCFALILITTIFVFAKAMLFGWR